jgi:hypothetical protein
LLTNPTVRQQRNPHGCDCKQAATSRLMHLQFVETESTFDYFEATRAYLDRYGKPIARFTPTSMLCSGSTRKMRRPQPNPAFCS